MPLEVNTLICQVEDMDRAVAFYRDILELPPSYSSPYWTSIPIGGIRIGLHPPFEGSEPPYSLPGKGWVVGMQTDDIRALRAKLEAAGAWVMEGYHDTPSGAVMDFRDPDGHALQAMQPGAKAKDLA